MKKVIKIKTKEPSIKVVVGKESMEDEKIAENCNAVYNAVISSLPRNKQNIKNVMIKFTMTKPIEVNIT